MAMRGPGSVHRGIGVIGMFFRGARGCVLLFWGVRRAVVLVATGLLAVLLFPLLTPAKAPGTVGPTVSRITPASPAMASGSRWSVQPTPNPRAPTGQLLFGTCTNGSSCVAVGTSVKPSKVGVTLAERWNGRGWHVQPTPNPAGAKVRLFSGVACSAQSARTAVGDSVGASGTAVNV